jgi:carbamoyl-phosphate synthase large subunit
MIGANRTAIDKAEDRGKFRKLMHEIGLKTPRSILAHDYNQARQAAEEMGFPLIVRPSFTMGGSGGGIAYDIEELQTICEHGFDLSPTHECLIDESIIGWKEYELEVVRDKNDNCIIICSIENIDPMGVHTGDSITVAPAQTLTDKEYQRMRSAAFKVLRAIGVETGGANVQFAVNPDGGEMVVIEMNPRVSRSSALASKATGFPIAKVAAKLALGYHLNELKNEITAGRTPVSFEPSIDYVVVKMPRFHFEKFPGVNDILTTQMKSVGEAMGFGANFKAALQKTIRSLDLRFYGLESMPLPQCVDEHELISSKLKIPRADRLWWIATAFRNGFTIAEVSCLTKIDLWFLQHIYELICFEDSFKDINFRHLSESDWREIKQQGFADKYLANMWGVPEIEVYQQRREQLVTPAYKCIDTCAAEFPTSTAYMYQCTYKLGLLTARDAVDTLQFQARPTC